MTYPRDGHRVCRVGNFIYCCGGEYKSADYKWSIYQTNERYNLTLNKWQTDVPDFSEPKKNMALVVVDNTWIYSFGGANYDNLK